MKSLRSLFILLPIFSVASCASEPKPPVETLQQTPVVALPTTIAEAVDSSYRSPANKERDAFRHPLETVQFFGLEPYMRVIEISPGAGWYSEILAPLLTPKGEFIAAVQTTGSEGLLKAVAEYKAWFEGKPELKATFIPLELGTPLAVSEPVDMIVTFRNVHNWMNQNKAQEEFKAFFAALKPGGILGVVEHRADPKKKQDPKAKSGYVKESEVIRYATTAGFKLDAKSEINANPKDSKDYPDGVWTLPPTFQKGDVDHQKYADIGESDRMTLRFIKAIPKEKAVKGSKGKVKEKDKAKVDPGTVSQP